MKKKQAKQRLERSSEIVVVDRKSDSGTTALGEYAKAALRGMLMNPMVLQWLLIKVPAVVGKIVGSVVLVLSWLNPFD